jgi:hypothetical protein
VSWAARHPHVVLLAVLLVTQAVMALAGPQPRVVSVVFELAFAATVIATLLIVFPAGRARGIALALLAPAMIIAMLQYTWTVRHDSVPAIAFHVSGVLFLGFAVASIVRRLFQRPAVDMDGVLGAFAGYLLIGRLWGNLYAIVEIAAPGAFQIAPAVQWELAEWHQRRALFNYLSFATLTSLGYADITPVGPVATTLTWMEVMVAQFYMAVVVALIVGMKLAHVVRGERP